MAEINIGLTLLYTFFGVLQIYIYLIGGVIGAIKKKFNSDGLVLINKLVVNIYAPAFTILEVSRMATIENIKLYYILAVSTLLCIVVRLFISYVISKIIKTDEKTLYCYVMVLGFPSLGVLPLVIGKSLCYVGCPLYGDTNCNNILGLMMVNYLIFSILLFTIGFIFKAKVAKNYKQIKEKLKVIWYRFITLTKRENTYVSYMVRNYIKSSSDAVKIIHKFNQENNLEVDENFNYTYTSLNIALKNEITVQIQDEIKQLSAEDINKSALETSLKWEVIMKNQIHETSLVKRKHHNEYPSFYDLKRNKSTENFFIDYTTYFFNNSKNIQMISSYLTALYNEIESYIINSSKIKDKSILLDELVSEGKLHLNYIKSNIPIFHYPKGLILNIEDIRLITDIWNNYKIYLKKNNLIYQIDSNSIDVDLCFIIQKLLNPPIMGCILGLLIGMSGMRDILFSSNHYYSNLFELLTVTSKTYVPFILAASGFNLMKTLSSNTTILLRKSDKIISFPVLYIMFPLLGYGFIYFFKDVFKGIVVTSKVFRFSLFVPFILPITPVYLLLVSAFDGLYKEEYGYLFSVHTLLLFCLLTVEILIFFIIIN